MKNLLLLLFCVSFGSLQAQNPTLDKITNAIGSGNADALGTYFEANVEVAILDNEDVYGKAQAIKVIKSFFEKNKPTSFTQVHHGASKDKDAQYCIGNLATSTGKYRVYVYMKVSGSSVSIEEFRFDAS